MVNLMFHAINFIFVSSDRDAGQEFKKLVVRQIEIFIFIHHIVDNILQRTDEGHVNGCIWKFLYT